jgi:hypothetical protein
MVTEGKEGAIKSMIEKHGLYYAIKLMGGFDYSMEDYISKEDKITFIKEIVTKLCEEYDDVEVGGPYFSRNMGIIYDETYEEKQIIEFYNPVFITVERFTKEVDGAEYDYDDFYLGSFQVPYEELTHSLINEIFHLMITKI